MGFNQSERAQGPIFVINGIERWRYIFTLNKFWDQQAHWTDLDNWESRRQNSFYTKRYS